MGDAGAETLPIRSAHDVVRIRQAVRRRAAALGFGLVDQTKMITAASELARNALEHGGGGDMHMEIVDDGRREGLRLTFEDQGPGIASLDTALRDGYSTGAGLGLGLSGARRLVHRLDIDTAPGRGTRVTIVRWTT
jgi:serine/threonine-protein kinase RsbT